MRSLNVSAEVTYDTMSRTKRLVTANSKRSMTCQKPLALRQRKIRTMEMEKTKFSRPFSTSPLKSPPVRRENFWNEHSPSATKNDPESFHCAIGPILMVAQFFGILPVAGVLKPTPMKLKFVKFSFLTAYAVCAIAMLFVMLIFVISHVARMLDSTTSQVQVMFATATSDVIFYSGNMLSLIIFFWLSPRWVILQRDWRSMEQFIDSNKVERPKLRWKFYAISSFILLLAVTDYVFYAIMDFQTHDWTNSSKNEIFQTFLQTYAFDNKFILQTENCTVGFSVLIFIANKIASFMWNFTDLFIMMVATGLAERYKVLNKEVMTHTSKPQTAIDWCGYREDYAALSSMVKKVDNDISPIILLSFATNLYFICTYLLMGLTHANDNSLICTTIYFFGSFMYLLGRTISVSLLASRINDQSKVILPALYNCSASTYNVETERLIYQLTTDDIALTGLRFFSITRNFLMGVAAAVVTYEIVLLQFHTQNK